MAISRSLWVVGGERAKFLGLGVVERWMSLICLLSSPYLKYIFLPLVENTFSYIWLTSDSKNSKVLDSPCCMIKL